MRYPRTTQQDVSTTTTSSPGHFLPRTWPHKRDSNIHRWPHLALTALSSNTLERLVPQFTRLYWITMDFSSTKDLVVGGIYSGFSGDLLGISWIEHVRWVFGVAAMMSRLDFVSVAANGRWLDVGHSRTPSSEPAHTRSCFFFCVSLLCCRCFFWPAPTELPVRPGIPSCRRSMTMALIGASRPAGRRGSPSAVKTASQPWRRASFGRFDSPSTVQVPFLNPSAVQVTRRPHEKMSGRDTLPCARRPFRVRRKTTNGRPRKRTRTNKIIRPQDWNKTYLPLRIDRCAKRPIFFLSFVTVLGVGCPRKTQQLHEKQQLWSNTNFLVLVRFLGVIPQNKSGNWPKRNQIRWNSMPIHQMITSGWIFTEN